MPDTVSAGSSNTIGKADGAGFEGDFLNTELESTYVNTMRVGGAPGGALGAISENDTGLQAVVEAGPGLPAEARSEVLGISLRIDYKN